MQSWNFTVVCLTSIWRQHFKITGITACFYSSSQIELAPLQQSLVSLYLYIYASSPAACITAVFVVRSVWVIHSFHIPNPPLTILWMSDLITWWSQFAAGWKTFLPLLLYLLSHWIMLTFAEMTSTLIVKTVSGGYSGPHSCRRKLGVSWLCGGDYHYLLLTWKICLYPVIRCTEKMSIKSITPWVICFFFTDFRHHRLRDLHSDQLWDLLCHLSHVTAVKSVMHMQRASETDSDAEWRLRLELPGNCSLSAADSCSHHFYLSANLHSHVSHLALIGSYTHTHTHTQMLKNRQLHTDENFKQIKHFPISSFVTYEDDYSHKQLRL